MALGMQTHTLTLSCIWMWGWQMGLCVYPWFIPNPSEHPSNWANELQLWLLLPPLSLFGPCTKHDAISCMELSSTVWRCLLYCLSALLPDTWKTLSKT